KLQSYREKYIPEKIRIIFIAEAPPEDLSRFFYYPESNSHDSLFINLLRMLFPNYRKENNYSTQKMRKNKEEILSVFKENGYYLMDALSDPIPLDLSPGERKKLIKNRCNQLAIEIQKMTKNCNDFIGVVFIK